MKKLFFVVLLLAGFAACLEAARSSEDEKPPPRARAAGADDVQDVLYIGAGRPAILRLHLRVNQRPVFANWEAVMRRLFAFLDRNESGGLDRVEGGKAPSTQQVQEFFQGNLTTFTGRAALPSVPFEQLDADRDGKITFEEFCDYYRKNGAGPVLLTANVAGGQDGTADRVFDLLDTNKDGKLSREELLAAEKILFPFDTNDDELVSPAELGINLNPNPPRQAVQPNAPMQQAPPPPLVLVPRDDGGSRRTGQMSMAREVLARLDKDKSGKLSLEESGFPKETFAKLDRNRDGQLDVLELARWVGGKPEAEFTITLGVGPAGRRVAQPVGFRGRAGGQGMGLALEQVRLAIQPINTPPPNVMRLKQLILRQFDIAAKRQKRGFLVKRELSPQADFYMSSIFDMADRNNDGKLTREEVQKFSELFEGAHGGQLALAVRSNGQALFQALDANGDGQLGVRELRTAWERLKEFDRDGDGYVGRNEFPQQLSLSVSTSLNLANLPAAALAGRAMPYNPAQGAGPMWFRKMDRNGDGDVSRKEWLGPREEFDRIDTDGDGLISVEEAEAADARWRKKE